MVQTYFNILNIIKANIKDKFLPPVLDKIFLLPLPQSFKGNYFHISTKVDSLLTLVKIKFPTICK